MTRRTLARALLPLLVLTLSPLTADALSPIERCRAMGLRAAGQSLKSLLLCDARTTPLSSQPACLAEATALLERRLLRLRCGDDATLTAGLAALLSEGEVALLALVDPQNDPCAPDRSAAAGRLAAKHLAVRSRAGVRPSQAILQRLIQLRERFAAVYQRPGCGGGAAGAAHQLVVGFAEEADATLMGGSADLFSIEEVPSLSQGLELVELPAGLPSPTVSQAFHFDSHGDLRGNAVIQLTSQNEIAVELADGTLTLTSALNVITVSLSEIGIARLNGQERPLAELSQASAEAVYSGDPVDLWPFEAKAMFALATLLRTNGWARNIYSLLLDVAQPQSLSRTEVSPVSFTTNGISFGGPADEKLKNKVCSLTGISIEDWIHKIFEHTTEAGLCAVIQSHPACADGRIDFEVCVEGIIPPTPPVCHHVFSIDCAELTEAVCQAGNVQFIVEGVYDSVQRQCENFGGTPATTSTTSTTSTTLLAPANICAATAEECAHNCSTYCSTPACVQSASGEFCCVSSGDSCTGSQPCNDNAACDARSRCIASPPCPVASSCMPVCDDRCAGAHVNDPAAPEGCYDYRAPVCGGDELPCNVARTVEGMCVCLQAAFGGGRCVTSADCGAGVYCAPGCDGQTRVCVGPCRHPF